MRLADQTQANPASHPRLEKLSAEREGERERVTVGGVGCCGAPTSRPEP